MLIEFSASNFGSFRDEFRLSMLATDIDRHSDRGIVLAHINGEDEPLRLLRSVAIYGYNASGKSTVLRAANALAWLLMATPLMSSDSSLDWCFEPFRLGTGRERPCSLGILGVIAGKVIDYQVSYDRASIVKERLVERHRAEDVVLIDRVGKEVAGAWSKDPLFQLIAPHIRANALLLALADVLLPQLAAGIAQGIKALVSTAEFGASGPNGRDQSPAARRAHGDANFAEWLLRQLKAADLGIVDLRSHQMNESGIAASVTSPARARPLERTRHVINFLHRNEEGMPVQLPFDKESAGTKRLVEMSSLLFDLPRAKEQRAVFVDEMDTSLHPELMKAIVRHLNCDYEVSAHLSQLVFTAHDLSLIDGEASTGPLRRDQVYLTEKGPDGASQLISLADFRERANHNLKRRYLQGRYGGLPSLGEFPD